eukprot:scaffold100667_cov18-Tisochrysis_lutea.AAC.1
MLLNVSRKSKHESPKAPEGRQTPLQVRSFLTRGAAAAAGCKRAFLQFKWADRAAHVQAQPVHAMFALQLICFRAN